MNNIKKEMISWVKSIGLALGIVFICRQFIFSPTIVLGESMSPTFENSDRIIISKTSKIEHFDMITFRAPDENENYIKRVIGLPGDHVQMKNDILYINEKRYDEPYLQIKKEKLLPGEKLTEDFDEKVVPEGHYFVLGDNRRVSKDSRIFGYIHKDSVQGEVKFRFYPIQEMGIPE